MANYKNERKQLTKLLDIIQECLKSKEYTNEEKMEFVDMAAKLLSMLMVL